MSAPLGADIRHIREVLVSRGVVVLGFDDARAGGNLLQSAIEMIRRVDLFVAVLTGDAAGSRATRDNVLVELGIAAGFGRQVLIFAPAKGDVLPPDVQGMLTVRSGLANRDAIAFALDQVIAAPERRPLAQSARPAAVERRVLGDGVDGLRERYLSILNGPDGYQFEKLVAETIRLSGVDVVSESSRQRTPIDLAVWSDELQSTVGNPLVIEVKRRLVRRGDLRKAVEQLGRASEAAGAEWSLLVYGEAAAGSNRTVGHPTVLFIAFPELLEAMRTSTFVDVVRDLRNRRIHGVL